MPPSGEHFHLLPNHQQRSDHVPTAKPSAASSFAAAAPATAGEEKIPCVEEKACSAANKIIITASLAVFAIFSIAMAFTAFPFLPPLPSVTLDSISGSAVHTVPASRDSYAVEDFAATFSIRNNAKEAMIYTHYRVDAVQLFGEDGNSACRFGTKDLTMFESAEPEPREFEQGGSLTVQLAVPSMTVKVGSWVVKDINDPVSAVGVSTLRLKLEYRARYRGKAWPEQVTLYSFCENIVARLVPMQNATRRVELEYKYDHGNGKHCPTFGTWFDLKFFIVFYLGLLALSIAVALSFTFRRVIRSKNNK